MSKWPDLWQTEKYITAKKQNFNIVNTYLTTPPSCILDIGCGYAYESMWFQKKYDCKLYLLEGNTNNNNTREIRYGKAEDFKFYNDTNQLLNYWQSQNMQFTFVDGNNPIIDDDVIFDVVYSFLSCGFHYPADTYKDLIQKHTNANSKIIMDIRKVKKQNIEIIEVIKKEAKSQKAVIKFIAQ